MSLTVNEENMVKAANYIEDVLRGNGGSATGSSKDNSSMWNSYQMSEQISPKDGMGFGADNGGLYSPTFEYKGVITTTKEQRRNPRGDVETYEKKVNDGSAKEYEYADSDAPWSEPLRHNVKGAVDNRRDDVFNIIQELEAYRTTIMGTLKDLLGQDYDNAGIIDKTGDDEPEESGQEGGMRQVN